MATVVKSKDVILNKTYDPHIPCEDGVCSKTVPGTTFRMNHLVVPPGKRDRAHYHCHTAAGNYIIKGRLRMYRGPFHDQQVFSPGGKSNNALSKNTISLQTGSCLKR